MVFILYLGFILIFVAMIREIINIIMGLLYLFIGGFVFAKNWFLIELSPIAGGALATLFMIYGIFRMYRAIKALRTKNY